MRRKFGKFFVFLGINAPGAVFASLLITNNALRAISGDIALFVAPSGAHVGLIALSVAWFIGQAFTLLVFATLYTAYSASKEPLARLIRLIGAQEYRR